MIKTLSALKKDCRRDWRTYVSESGMVALKFRPKRIRHYAGKIDNTRGNTDGFYFRGAMCKGVLDIPSFKLTAIYLAMKKNGLDGCAIVIEKGRKNNHKK